MSAVDSSNFILGLRVGLPRFLAWLSALVVLFSGCNIRNFGFYCNSRLGHCRIFSRFRFFSSQCRNRCGLGFLTPGCPHRLLNQFHSIGFALAGGFGSRPRGSEKNECMKGEGQTKSTDEEGSCPHGCSSTSTRNDISSAPALLHRSMIFTTSPKATRRSARIVISAFECPR